jgi:phosphate starvation-inducible protein PhoH
MSKNAVRHTRKTKIEQAAPVVHKDKFVEEPTQILPPKLLPKTAKQGLQLKYLQEGRQVVWAIGASGSGKSIIAAYHAAEQLRKKKIDKIILVRANVSVGKSLGATPGTLTEKLLPFFTQTLIHLSGFMGKGFSKYALDKGVITMQSLEHFRGHSVENAFVILEEGQNLDFAELEMVLTRLGDGSQLCVTGDQKQTDLKSNSGLVKTIQLIDKMIDQQPEYMDDGDLYQLEKNIGVVNYTVDDVVRSGLCRAFVKMYHNN